MTRQQEAISNPDRIVIPKDYGMVKSKYAGKSGKLIIHIQDAHCNYEAQSNIAKIIETLAKNDNLNFVAVEGADGLIDTSWFRSFPDAEVRKEVADYFMKKGEITGPEFLSITTNYPIRLFGAETREYYLQNLNAFTSSYPLKDETEKYLGKIKTILNRLKGYIYSEELKSMDSKSADYESKKIQFNDYVRFLQEKAEKYKINLRQYEDLFKLVNVLVYEKKIDFNLTDKERGSLIEALNKRMSKDGLTELVNQSLSFKNGKISSVEYYAYLKELSARNGIDLMKDYPNLYNYIIYNSVYSKIDNEKLFANLKKLERDIKERLFQNDDQRTLDKLFRHIDILLGLVNIKLLNEDFEYFRNNKDGFTYQAFADFIKDKITQYGLVYELDEPTDAVAEAISKLEEFYLIAVKRDKALVENTLNGMDKAGQKIAALVTGGFHSEGIARLLQQQDVSYLVVCPSITKDVPTPYIQILMNQRTSFEEILAGGQETRHGLLAPALVSWARNLSMEELQKMGLTVRVQDMTDEWIRRHIFLFMTAAVKADIDGKISTDKEKAKDFYKSLREQSLILSGKSAAEAKEEVSRLAANPVFNDAFDKFYARKKMSLREAYSSPESFNLYVLQQASILAETIPELEGMMRRYSEFTDKDEKAKLAKEIDALIQERYNSKIVEETVGASLETITADNIVRDIPKLSDFIKSPEYAEYLRKGRDLRLFGGRAMIDMFGGAASRLFGEGQKADTSLSFAAHDVYSVAKSQGHPASELIRQGGREGISMATRLILQERLALQEDIKDYYAAMGRKDVPAEETERLLQDAIKATPRIVVINDESGLSVLKEFADNGHYGHDWKLVVFVVQPTYKGIGLR
ncbi:MAG: hypothetical protein NC933_05115, partial [Candidatus Omnitrophica bacterium]|nr:hypothetical protein [Candidatus Omnitrophota bacterium]